MYYDNSAGTIHVSGHASQEEQKLLLQLVKPKYFIPVHGEYRHLFRHAALAHQLGCVSGEILLLEDGKVIEFTEDGVHRRDPVTAGRVCVDSGSLEEIEEVVIRDRKHLSEDGVVVSIIAIDKHTGKMESPSGNRHSRIDERQRAGTYRGSARGHYRTPSSNPTRKKNPTGASSRKRFA